MTRLNVGPALVLLSQALAMLGTGMLIASFPGPVGWVLAASTAFSIIETWGLRPEDSTGTPVGFKK